MAKDTLPSIYEAFIELCKEKPCEKITITDVAEKCKISRKTFYYHFSDIDDLVSACVENELSAFSVNFDSKNKPSQILFLACDRIKEDLDAINNLLNSHYARMIRNKFYNYLIQNSRPIVLGYAQGTLYTDADIDNLVVLFSVTIMGFLSKWFVIGDGMPSPVAIERSLKMFKNLIPFMINNISRDEMRILFDDKNSIMGYGRM